jgi:membrane protease YdiL (CAAX protease family)
MAVIQQKPVSMTTPRQDALRYTLFAYAATWLLWLPAILQSLRGNEVGPAAFAIGFIGLMVPSITGIIFLRREAPARTWLRQLFLPSKNLWLFLSFLLLPLVMVAAHAIHIFFLGGQAPVIAAPYQLPLLFLSTLVAGGPLFEEIGWRGYLQPKLLRQYPELVTGMLMGIAWGIWHLPLFFIRGMFHEQLPLDQFFITVVLMSVIICIVQVRAKSGIWPALILHTFMNLTQQVTPLFNDRGHTLWTITNAVLAVLLLAFALLPQRRSIVRSTA